MTPDEARRHYDRLMRDAVGMREALTHLVDSVRSRQAAPGPLDELELDLPAGARETADARTASDPLRGARPIDDRR